MIKTQKLKQKQIQLFPPESMFTIWQDKETKNMNHTNTNTRNISSVFVNDAFPLPMLARN